MKVLMTVVAPDKNELMPTAIVEAKMNKISWKEVLKQAGRSPKAFDMTLSNAIEDILFKDISTAFSFSSASRGASCDSILLRMSAPLGTVMLSPLLRGREVL